MVDDASNSALIIDDPASWDPQEHSFLWCSHDALKDGPISGRIRGCCVSLTPQIFLFLYMQQCSFDTWHPGLLSLFLRYKVVWSVRRYEGSCREYTNRSSVRLELVIGTPFSFLFFWEAGGCNFLEGNSMRYSSRILYFLPLGADLALEWDLGEPGVDIASR